MELERSWVRARATQSLFWMLNSGGNGDKEKNGYSVDDETSRGY